MTMPILPQVSPKASPHTQPEWLVGPISGCFLRQALIHPMLHQQVSRGKGGYKHRRQDKGKERVQFQEEDADKDDGYTRQ